MIVKVLSMLMPPLLVLVYPLLAVPAPHQEGTAVGEVGRGGALTAAVSQSANKMKLSCFMLNMNVCQSQDGW